MIYFLTAVVVLFIIIRPLITIIGYVLCFFYTRVLKRRNTLVKLEDAGRGDLQSKTQGMGEMQRYIKRYIDGYYRLKVIRTGNIPSHHIRNFIYKNIFKVKMDKSSVIYGGAEIRAPYKLSLGTGCIIGDNAILDARSGIIIEDHVNFSSNVCLWTLQHDYNCPEFSTNNQGLPITIKKRAWLGPNVTVLPGVTIGEGAVIGAGAVVTKDIEPYTLSGGIPAKKIGARRSDLTYEFKGSYTPFY